MAATDDTGFPAGTVPLRRGRLLAAAAGVAALGFLAGAVLEGPRQWQVEGYAVSAVNAIGLQDEDGWDYSVPLDVWWQSSNGTVHDSGRPDCLPPTGGLEGPVRIHAVEADVDGMRWRQVVLVSCLG